MHARFPIPAFTLPALDACRRRLRASKSVIRMPIPRPMRLRSRCWARARPAINRTQIRQTQVRR